MKCFFTNDLKNIGVDLLFHSYVPIFIVLQF